MAVVYQTGIASDPADLVSKLATFAAANGWTVNTPASGRVFIKDTCLVGVSSDTDEVFLRGAITYNGAAAWNAQTNNSGNTVSIDCGTGPFTAYHFFVGDEDGADYIHVVIEIAAGRYRHFSFGEMIKHGTYTGGTYVDGTNWDNSTNFQHVPDSGQHQVICDGNTASGTGHVWVDYDSKVNNWQLIRGPGTFTTTLGIGSFRDNGMISIWPSLGIQPWNLRNNMAPLTYFVNRSDSLRSPVGRIPNMRCLGLHNLTPGETLSIGGDDWLCFPVIQRTETFVNTIESSGMYGYAFKTP
jgi:subtilisin family serine protease